MFSKEATGHKLEITDYQNFDPNLLIKNTSLQFFKRLLEYHHANGQTS